MAIYHCTVKIIGRSSGRSAVAAAAYRSGETIKNNYDGMTHDYSAKRWIEYSEVVLPPNAPNDFADRSVLWNSVESSEKSSKAQLAREFELALPLELSREKQIELVREFAKETLVKEGMIVDYSIHDPPLTDDHRQPVDLDGNPVTKKSEMVFRNPHAHVMATMRPLDESGKWQKKTEIEYICRKQGKEQAFTASEFAIAKEEGWEKQYQYLTDSGKKWLTAEEGTNLGLERISRSPKTTPYGRKNQITEEWNSREKIVEWRQAWEQAVNKKLEELGFSARIDSHSYLELGIEKIPSVHLGPAATNIQKRYFQKASRTYPSDLYLINNRISENNGELRKLRFRLEILSERILNDAVQLKEQILQNGLEESALIQELTNIEEKYGREIQRTQQYEEEHQIILRQKEILLDRTASDSVLVDLARYEENVKKKYGFNSQEEFAELKQFLEKVIKERKITEKKIASLQNENRVLVKEYRELIGKMNQAGLLQGKNKEKLKSRLVKPAAKIKGLSYLTLKKTVEQIEDATEGEVLTETVKKHR